MPNDKLDKPSQLQFAEAITANIPEAEKANLAGTVLAAYLFSKALKRDKRK